MLVITVEGTYELERADPLRPRQAGVILGRSTARKDGPATESRANFGDRGSSRP